MREFVDADLISPFSLWEKGRGKRGVAVAARYSSPLPNPLPKGEGVRREK
jgi:hypothetical protein